MRASTNSPPTNTLLLLHLTAPAGVVPGLVSVPAPVKPAPRGGTHSPTAVRTRAGLQRLGTAGSKRSLWHAALCRAQEPGKSPAWSSKVHRPAPRLPRPAFSARRVPAVWRGVAASWVERFRQRPRQDALLPGVASRQQCVPGSAARRALLRLSPSLPPGRCPAAPRLGGSFLATSGRRQQQSGPSALHCSGHVSNHDAHSKPIGGLAGLAAALRACG